MPPALLLDLDKTLVNVEDHTDYCAAVEAVRAHLGELADPPDVPATSWGRCAVQAMSVLVALAGQDHWGHVSSIIEGFEAAGAERAEPMPGLRAFLEATADRPRAIVTLCGPRSAHRVCERFGVPIEAVITRAPEMPIKPAPHQVQAALEALGVAASDAVMIGDSSWDEGAAHAAGVRFVGIDNGRPTRQFGEGTPVVATLLDALPLLA